MFCCENSASSMQHLAIALLLFDCLLIHTVALGQVCHACEFLRDSIALILKYRFSDTAITFQDHWQLTTVLCSDFSQAFHNSALSTLQEGTADPTALHPFKDVSAYFQVHNNRRENRQSASW